MPYYAVAKGNPSGIYTSWSQCFDAISKYSNAKYKKFASLEKAHEFITKYGNENTQSKSETETINDSQITMLCDYYVYTDGACSNNGRQNAKAGIGIYFKENDERNVSEALPQNEKQTTART